MLYLCPFCDAIAHPSNLGDGKVTAWDECQNGHLFENTDRSTVLRLSRQPDADLNQLIKAHIAATGAENGE